MTTQDLFLYVSSLLSPLTNKLDLSALFFGLLAPLAFGSHFAYVALQRTDTEIMQKMFLDSQVKSSH